MSKRTRVLKWLDKNPFVVEEIIKKNCKHEFETIDIVRYVEKPIFSYEYNVNNARDVKVKFCNKCGMRVSL